MEKEKQACRILNVGDDDLYPAKECRRKPKSREQGRRIVVMHCPVFFEPLSSHFQLSSCRLVRSPPAPALQQTAQGWAHTYFSLPPTEPQSLGHAWVPASLFPWDKTSPTWLFVSKIDFYKFCPTRHATSQGEQDLSSSLDLLKLHI